MQRLGDPVSTEIGAKRRAVEGVVFSAGKHSETLFPDVCAALD
jgi:hypothetical protein